MNHLNSNDILSMASKQIIPVLVLRENISYALDNKELIKIVILDFAKVFDSVPHQWLLTSYNLIEMWLVCSKCSLMMINAALSQ